MDVTQEKALEIIKETKGRVFGVEFVKRDLKVRRMSCRLDVKKGVKGLVDRTAEDEKHGYLTVYDFNANKTKDTQGGFRRINLKTLRSINFQRIHYKVKRDL